MSTVREAMVADPRSLPASASAQEAGDLLQRPEVRAVYVTDGERLAGVVTRKTLVREVVAAGRDPRGVALREIAEPPYHTLDAALEASERDILDGAALAAAELPAPEEGAAPPGACTCG